MKKALAVILTAAALTACSTTRVLPDGKYRLASNKVSIEGGKIPAAEVTSYIRQQPNSYFIFGWNPFLNVYNWSDGSGKGINRIWEKIGTAPVVFNPQMLESSAENISGHLENLGWYGSSVNTKVDTVRRLAHVTFNVKPGRQYRIDSLVFDIPGGEFGEEFRADLPNLSIGKGSVISEKALEAESVRSAGYFNNLGYYDFNRNNYSFEADTLGERNILYYRIKNGPGLEKEPDGAPLAKYRFGKVSISHASEVPFKEDLLLKLNTISPGTLYSKNVVNTTYSRMSALKLFNGVSIDLTPTDSSTVDCDIRLTGSSIQGFKVNAEASTNSTGLIGLSPQLNYFHKNIFHGGEWLNLSFTGNWQFKPRTDIRSEDFGINASISFPKLLGIPLTLLKGSHIPRTEIKASFNYQNRPEYRRTMASLNYGYTGQFSPTLFYQFNLLQLNLVKNPYISSDFLITILQNRYLWDSFEDHVDAGVGGTLYYTTDSNIVPKNSYRYVRFNFDLAGNLISLFNDSLPLDDVFEDQHLLFGVPYMQYVKAELYLGRTIKFGRNNGQALAMRLMGGYGHAYGNSYSLPFEKQFYCGGASSMRGWQARSLGPGCEEYNDFFTIPSQVGDIKFEADLEYRFNMFWKFEGALFAEVGNVWTNVEESFKDRVRSLAADWGLGLRVNLDFILLRFDAGFKLRDPSKPAGEMWRTPEQWVSRGGCSFHFGVGYPF